MKIDVHEPSNIINLIRQSTPVSVENLNGGGKADYLWTDFNGDEIQWERKQVGEILGGIDKVEDQLSRQLENGNTGLITEGFFVPDKDGCRGYQFTGRRMLPGRFYSISYAAVMSWYDQIERYIPCRFTANYEGTAMLLVAMYRNSQKEDHQTFNRYYVPKVHHKNPHVATLLGICAANPKLRIGEVKAKALIAKFTTVGKLLHATPNEIATVEGLGIPTANKLLSIIND